MGQTDIIIGHYLAKRKTIMTHYYATKVGVNWEYNPSHEDVLYFANSSDLMDHLQMMFNCTADEIEFHPKYRVGELVRKLEGSIDAKFCENHNRNKIDTDEIGYLELDEINTYWSKRQ